MDFTVRRLIAGDAALYQPVRLEGLRDHPEAFGSTVEREAPLTLTEVAVRLERSATFGAFAGGALVGVMGIVVQDSAKLAHKGMVVGVYVRAAARGSGAADALMDAIIAHATGRLEQLHLDVSTENVPARRLYERHGFELCGWQPRSIKLANGRYVDEVLMWREV